MGLLAICYGLRAPGSARDWIGHDNGMAVFGGCE